MKTLATVQALLLSVDAISMPHKELALTQTYDQINGNCGWGPYPACTQHAFEDVQLDAAVDEESALFQKQDGNCGWGSYPACTGRQFEDVQLEH